MAEYFVHESSYIDNDVEIGNGTKIWHFCHIQKGARIGENCSFGQNVNVSNNVKIGNQAEILNNMTQDQFDEFIIQIKEQVNLLNKTDAEYSTIKNMLLDIQKNNSSAREIVRHYLPDLFTGTLSGIASNIISNIMMR